MPYVISSQAHSNDLSIEEFLTTIKTSYTAVEVLTTVFEITRHQRLWPFARSVFRDC
jgi:hypothetical protein